MRKNPVARSLRSQHLQQRIVKPRKGNAAYTRKLKHRKDTSQ